MKIFAAALLVALPIAAQQTTVLHAARILDVAAGKTLSPGEVLLSGKRISYHPETAREEIVAFATIRCSDHGQRKCQGIHQAA